MGVDIQIFVNHEVKGKSFKSRINDIEKRLQKKIQVIPNIPYSKENLPKETEKYEEVIYYITNPNEEENFKIFDEIKINTNFAYFSGLRIFKNTMIIYPNRLSTDSYNWKLYLGDEYEKKQKSIEYKGYNKAWKKFQKFTYQIIDKLGGNKIVYIDDHSFQEAEDLFYKGKELEEVMFELQKVGPLFEIEKLYNNFDKIFEDYNLKHYGFYEELK
ncbi:MAG: hypothetical protein J7F05_07605 [Trichodesmium erythraeum GBRTRLIN201]|jgi:uncharacterized protein YozE (UPF0346 family)|nr:hypothetical protein [Trichodesmium erythraeum GBRTRLIN201]